MEKALERVEAGAAEPEQKEYTGTHCNQPFETRKSYTALQTVAQAVRASNSSGHQNQPIASTTVVHQ